MRDRHAGQRARFALRNAGIGGFRLTEQTAYYYNYTASA